MSDDIDKMVKNSEVTLNEMIEQGVIKALCPNCHLYIEHLNVKKCEFCKKKINKDDIILKNTGSLS